MQDFSRFQGTRVLVVGDVILDRYWWGNVSRISPEAPVPVVRMSETTYAAGGAANVAANVAGLGASPTLVGVIGKDNEAALFPNVLEAAGVPSDSLIQLPRRQTTVKTRVLAHNQQVARVDQEDDAELTRDDEEIVLERLLTSFGDAGSVIISDYAKGFLTRRVLQFLFRECASRKIPVLVDPKGNDYSKYDGASLITPNKKEAAEAAHVSDKAADIVSVAGQILLDSVDADAFLITQGEDGMTLFRRDEGSYHLPITAQQVYDVTGAGDTVIATLGVAAAVGMDWVDAALIANLAAGIVVGHVGTTAISISELHTAMNATAVAKS